MDEKVIEIIKEDIRRCSNQTANEGSQQLFQALMGKYNGLFPGFSADIPVSGKASAGGAFNYRPELNAIKEKLELLLITEQSKDPLYKFKEMLSDDIMQLKNILDGTSELGEQGKLDIYMSVTAKYHPYIPQLGSGLYEYNASLEFYEEVSGDSLRFNIQQIYNKLLAFQALNCPGLGEMMTKNPSTVVNINNLNENTNTVSISFDAVRESVNSMTSLPEEEIAEIQKKIDEIEEIVHSKESKSKKWSHVKEIIKWIADKGVDVGIALLPLLLKIA